MKVLKVLLLLAGTLVLLTACGSGGGGGGGGDGVGEGGGDGGGGGGNADIPYEGKETPVQIDNDNADTVAENAYQNSNSMRNSTGGIASSSVNESAAQISRPYSAALTELVMDLVEQTDMFSPSTGNISIAASERIEGTCSSNPGYAVLTDSGNSATFTFYNYCTNGNGSTTGVVVNGTMYLSGNSSTISISFDSFTVRLIESSVSATMSGNMTITITSDDSATATMNLVMRDNATGKTYKCENLYITMSGLDGETLTFSMSGRFYDPDYGYSDITTEEPFRAYNIDNVPFDGTMVITGANGFAGYSTKVKLTILDRYSYQIEADTTGDGDYNYSTGTKNW